MAAKSFYLDALLTFDRPATLREVYDKTIEMHGNYVQGDRSSCRISLNRFVDLGKVEKRDNKFMATKLAIDPIDVWRRKIQLLEVKNLELQEENKILKTRIARLESGI